MNPNTQYPSEDKVSEFDNTLKTFTSDANGNATVTVKLRDDEQAIFGGLKHEATYKITEAASDHVASYKIKSLDGEEVVIAKASDTNNNMSAKALSTSTETVDAGDGIIYVMYENNRDFATKTSVPSYLKIWLIALAVLASIASVMLWRRYHCNKLNEQ